MTDEKPPAIVEFLIGLADDANEAKFRSDADRDDYVDKFPGLSNDERTHLKNRDFAQVKQHVNNAVTAAGAKAWVCIWVIK
jgi:hypothetical protein